MRRDDSAFQVGATRFHQEESIRSAAHPLSPRLRPPPPPSHEKNSPSNSIIELSNGLKIDFVPWELEPSHKKLAEAAFVKTTAAAAAARTGEASEGDEKKKRTRTRLLRCRVYEARLRRGTTTLWHSHDRDTAYVVCGDGEEGGQEPEAEAAAEAAVVVGNETVVDGGKSLALASLSLKRGQAFCFLAGGRPFVHRLTFPGDSDRAGAHIVGVEVSEEEEGEEEGQEEEGEEEEGEESGKEEDESSSSSCSSYSPLPPCYELVQKSKFFDYYKLKLPARGGTTGKRRFPPEGATAAVVVAVRPSRREKPLSVSSCSSSAPAWRSLASHGGAFAVFEGGDSEEVEVRNDAEVEFEAAVVVVK